MQILVYKDHNRPVTRILSSAATSWLRIAQWASSYLSDLFQAECFARFLTASSKPEAPGSWHPAIARILPMVLFAGCEN